MADEIPALSSAFFVFLTLRVGKLMHTFCVICKGNGAVRAFYAFSAAAARDVIVVPAPIQEKYRLVSVCLILAQSLLKHRAYGRDVSLGSFPSHVYDIDGGKRHISVSFRQLDESINSALRLIVACN